MFQPMLLDKKKKQEAEKLEKEDLNFTLLEKKIIIYVENPGKSSETPL